MADANTFASVAQEWAGGAIEQQPEAGSAPNGPDASTDGELSATRREKQFIDLKVKTSENGRMIVSQVWDYVKVATVKKEALDDPSKMTEALSKIHNSKGNFAYVCELCCAKVDRPLQKCILALTNDQPANGRRHLRRHHPDVIDDDDDDHPAKSSNNRVPNRGSDSVFRFNKKKRALNNAVNGDDDDMEGTEPPTKRTAAIATYVRKVVRYATIHNIPPRTFVNNPEWNDLVAFIATHGQHLQHERAHKIGERKYSTARSELLQTMNDWCSKPVEEFEKQGEQE